MLSQQKIGIKNYWTVRKQEQWKVQKIQSVEKSVNKQNTVKRPGIRHWHLDKNKPCLRSPNKSILQEKKEMSYLGKAFKSDREKQGSRNSP